MKISNFLTVSRIVFSPLFLVIFFIADFIEQRTIVFIVILWSIFLLIELSDLFDGFIARVLAQESELGKLLDPFADSLSRITYFLCFMAKGIMPLWIFVIVLYRDLFVAFFRLIVLKRGVIMGARISGKIKACIYALAGGVGLFIFSAQKLLILNENYIIINNIGNIVFIFVALIGVWSLIDYILPLFKKKY